SGLSESNIHIGKHIYLYLVVVIWSWLFGRGKFAVFILDVIRQTLLNGFTTSNIPIKPSLRTTNSRSLILEGTVSKASAPSAALAIVHNRIGSATMQRNLGARQRVPQENFPVWGGPPRSSSKGSP